MQMKKLKRNTFSNNITIKDIVSAIKKLKIVIPDKMYLKALYHRRIGKKLHLDNPITFNEKLQWLKLYDRNPLYTIMVDKYAVKDYVAGKIGSEYIIPTLGVWDKFDDIDFDKLPDKFVLKCTHDSGSIEICTNRVEFDWDNARTKLEKGLKKNYYYAGREWPYKYVPPRIIAEEYMEDESHIELKDYKLFMFNGKCKIIQVDFGRFTDHRRNIYDTDWNMLDVSIQYHRDCTVKINKPKMLRKMIEAAEILSKGIAHVRVDFYSLNDDRIKFGEMTFYHGSGFEKIEPDNWQKIMGDWIKLPSKSGGVSVFVKVDLPCRIIYFEADNWRVA